MSPADPVGAGWPADTRSRVATLGGPMTFAGQALNAYARGSSRDFDVIYLPSVADLWDALDNGWVDALLLAAATEHTGWSRTAEIIVRRPDAYTVWAEIVVPYRCVLVGHAGANIADIREIRGHGSLRECATYFNREMPNAVINIHKGSSAAALTEVEQSSETIAAVTTRAAAELTSLRVLANDVDDGARGAWWLIGRRTPELCDPITAIAIVTPSDALPTTLGLLAAHGLTVRDVMSAPGDALFSSTYLIVGDGIDGRDEALDAEIARCGATVVGHFSSIAANVS